MHHLIEQHYLPLLKIVLTPRRLDHSLGVMQVMGELAQIYNLELAKALTAGILHDAAKDLPPERYWQLVDEANLKLSHSCEADYVYYLHGPVGAYYVQQELGVVDPLTLAAIETHTYCADSSFSHNPLCWCLRFADILEPNRNWSGERLLFDDSIKLKELVYAGKLKLAARQLTGTIITWYTHKGVPVHPNLRRIQQDLANESIFDDPR